MPAITRSQARRAAVAAEAQASGQEPSQALVQAIDRALDQVQPQPKPVVKNTKSKNTKSKNTKSKKTKSENTKPENTKPENTKLENTKPKEPFNKSFQDFPPEIRNMIYKLVYGKYGKTVRGVENIKIPSLCKVSKRLRGEVSHFYFSRNHYDLSYQDHLKKRELSLMYFGDFEPMAKALSFHLPNFRSIEICSKETVLEVENSSWLHPRPCDFNYTLKLVHKDSKLVTDCKNDLIDHDDFYNNKGEAVVHMKEDLDLADEDAVFGAFEDAVQNSYGWANEFSAYQQTDRYPAIGWAMADLTPYINNQDYRWIFSHSGYWEASDHEQGLLEELEEEEERRNAESDDEDEDEDEDEEDNQQDEEESSDEDDEEPRRYWDTYDDDDPLKWGALDRDAEPIVNNWIRTYAPQFY